MRHFSPRCRRSVVQVRDDELLSAPIGPLAKAAAMYLRYGVCIPYRKAQEILRVLFGLSCVPASLVGFDRKAAKMGEAIYEDLREKIRASDVVHADETSWRNDGLNHFVWEQGNDNLAFFHIDRHRSADVAEAIFGKDFGGTPVRDRYQAYNGIGDWQSCLAHISSKAKEIRQEHALLPDIAKDKNTDSFLNSVRDFCFFEPVSQGRSLNPVRSSGMRQPVWKSISSGNRAKSVNRRLASSPLRPCGHT